jgi:hypothetical protein
MSETVELLKGRCVNVSPEPFSLFSFSSFFYFNALRQ